MRIALEFENNLSIKNKSQLKDQIISLQKKLLNIPNRRLAVIDTQFPWKKSGFRYWESIEIFNQRPDTLFFAVHPYVDYFPANVYSIYDFPKIAISEGITDVYCVFLNLTLSLIGKGQMENGVTIPGYIPNIDISHILKSNNIKLSSTIYPGGGLDPLTNKHFLDEINKNCYKIFTNVKEISEYIPRAISIPVIINTGFYSYRPRQTKDKIIITFCAHNAKRKGFPTLVKAFNTLPDTFHLNIIGDWSKELHTIKNKNFTYYGSQEPESIKSIYNQSDIFVNCSYKDEYALDGFPTTAAVDAMSTGCLLISTNPRKDNSLFKNGQDYIEFAVNDDIDLASKLIWVLNNMNESRKIAEIGANSVKIFFDSKENVRKKLFHILGF